MTQMLAPRSLSEALELKAAHPESVAVAGGTDLMVEINFGRLHPETLLDLSRVEELKAWRRENGSVFVGAGVTFSRIVRELHEFPGLVEAASSIGSLQIRNRATLGGNLVTASPAGDAIAALAACDATIVVARAGRTRRVPWREFFVAPKRTSLAAEELVVGAEWDASVGPGAFLKVGSRNAMVIAVASVCVQLDETGGRIRCALGSVGPTVLGFEAPLDGAGPDEVGWLAAAAARPIDDLRGSAGYRRHVVAVLARRACAAALARRC